MSDEKRERPFDEEWKLWHEAGDTALMLDELYIQHEAITELEARLRDREAEILRLRTHETAAAHALDIFQDDELRKAWKLVVDRMAEVRA